MEVTIAAVEDWGEGYIKLQECIRTVARVRACNYIKFETGWNLPPVLKIVTCPVHAVLT